jgi:predicted transcriptional regulator
MTLHLSLTPELEERLRQEAQRLGKPSETIALQLLADHLPQPLDERRAAAIAMLQEWMKEDDHMSAHEEAENTRILRMLDEDRPSYRKLFAESLKDDAP